MLYSDIRHRLIGVLKLLGVAALYVLLARAMLVYFSANGVVSIIWPPSGLALAVLLMGGKRYCYGVFLGAFLANAMARGVTLGMAAAIATGNTLEALLGAWLLTRDGRFDPAFRSLRDYLRLTVLAGFFGVSASALTGTTTLLVSGFLTTETYFHNLLHWWMGDALGIMLITPLILVCWRTKDDLLDAKQVLEAVLLLGLAFLVGQVLFLGWLHDSLGRMARGYWMFLFVTWVAVRLGPRGTVIVLTITAAQALLGAYQGIGFFANDMANAQLANYWFYMIILSVVGMVLATHLTERGQAEKELRASEQKFMQLFMLVPIPLGVVNKDGVIVYFNDQFTKVFGYTADDVPTLKEWWQLAYPDESYRQWAMDSWSAAVAKAAKEGADIEPAEYRVICKSGAERIILVGGISLEDNVLATFLDITERKRAEEQIYTLAFYDELTRLPNRRLLNDRLGKAMAASKRSGHYGALTFLDLDNFKPLNDTHGHGVGDLLLIEVAHRLTSCVRETDTVARFGGDEFVVILGELDADKAESTAQAGIIAEKIRATLAEPYVLKFQQEGNAETTVEHHCTSSIGVALFINREASPEDVLKWADIAMYQAKEGGRNRVHFYGS